MIAAASNIAITPISAPRREASKFDGLRRVRQSAAEDPAAGRQGPQEARAQQGKGVAAVVRLLDTEYLRVGNEEYAKDNKSFGATTLLSRQVHDDGRKVRCASTARVASSHEVTITDRTCGGWSASCQELPGQHVFQYMNGDGKPHHVTSSDVNDLSARQPTANSPPSISAPGARA